MAVWISLGAVAMGLMTVFIALYAVKQTQSKDDDDAL